MGAAASKTLRQQPLVNTSVFSRMPQARTNLSHPTAGHGWSAGASSPVVRALPSCLVFLGVDFFPPHSPRYLCTYATYNGLRMHCQHLPLLTAHVPSTEIKQLCRAACAVLNSYESCNCEQAIPTRRVAYRAQSHCSTVQQCQYLLPAHRAPIWTVSQPGLGSDEVPSCTAGFHRSMPLVEKCMCCPAPSTSALKKKTGSRNKLKHRI